MPERGDGQGLTGNGQWNFVAPNTSEMIAGLDGTSTTTVVAPSGAGGGNTLTVEGSGSYSYAGQIRDNTLGGSLALVKDGSGTQTLLGANTYSGGTTLVDGTLAIGNSQALGSGDLTQTGGTLKTDGINHEIVIAGDFDQTGGALELNIGGPPGSIHNDTVNVNGMANLSGNLVITYTPGVLDPTQSASYTFLTTTGGITHLGPGYQPPPLQVGALQLTVTSMIINGGLDLGVTLTAAQLPFTSVAGTNLTPNQFQVEAYLDRFDRSVASGPLLKLLGGLDVVSVDPRALGPAFNQLMPLNFAHFTSSIAFNNTSFLTEQMDGHFADHRLADGTFVGSTGGIDYSGLTVNNPDTAQGLQLIQSRLLAWNPAPSTGLLSDSSTSLLGGVDMKDVKAVRSSPYARPWDIFVSGNAVLGQDFSDPGTGLGHADSTSASVQLGADYAFTPHFIAGAFFDYGHSDVTLDAQNSSATVDTYMPGVYASFSDRGWYANAIGAYGFSSYTQARNVSIPEFGGTANSAPTGDQIVGNLDGGYDFYRGKWTFGPTAGLQYVHLDVNGYTESGLPSANLSVNRDEADSLRSRLGTRISYTFQGAGMIFTPHLDASWQHEFMDQGRGISSQFDGVGAGSFVVATENPSRDSALVDVGIDAEINKTVTVFTDYTVQAGQDNYFGQSIQAGVKIGF